MTDITTNHEAYKLLQTKYPRVDIDYMIFSVDEEYVGIDTHEKAIIATFEIWNKNRQTPYYVDRDKMIAWMIDIEEFLELPQDEYYDTRPKLNKTRFIHVPTPFTYWFAFLQPPHGVPYLTSDFVYFNNILFPNRSDTEVCCWEVDFSDYFDFGKEFVGAAMWTAYDKKEKTMVVIAASQCD